MRRRHIGIVFQFFNLLEGMTVLENVVLPAMIAGTKRKPAETRARDLLDLLGLGDKASDVPAVLSGGQRQRLAIARALANKPTLLLADEPTGALDTDGGREVLELFKRLHADGQTILMVTHNDEVASAADRIVRMRDGRVEGEGLAETVGATTGLELTRAQTGPCPDHGEAHRELRPPGRHDRRRSDPRAARCCRSPRRRSSIGLAAAVGSPRRGAVRGRGASDHFCGAARSGDHDRVGLSPAC